MKPIDEQNHPRDAQMDRATQILKEAADRMREEGISEEIIWPFLFVAAHAATARDDDLTPEHEEILRAAFMKDAAGSFEIVLGELRARHAERKAGN